MIPFDARVTLLNGFASQHRHKYSKMQINYACEVYLRMLCAGELVSDCIKKAQHALHDYTGMLSAHPVICRHFEDVV